MTVTGVGARVVKLIGDEVMFVADDAANACDAAEELVKGFGRGGEVKPRAGVAYGNVLVRGGDYYGPVVNLAARLTAEAVLAKVLVTEELAASVARHQFVPAGRRAVKGFDKPISVLSLVLRSR